MSALPAEVEARCPYCDEPVTLALWFSLEAEAGQLVAALTYRAGHHCPPEPEPEPCCTVPSGCAQCRPEAWC
jgi:hypothetical protein